MRSTRLNRYTKLESHSTLKRTRFEVKPPDPEHAVHCAAWRKAVMLRDGGKCRICEAIKAGKIVCDYIHPDMRYHLKKLEVHHLDGKRGYLLYDVEHSVTLCTWDHLYSPLAPHHNPKAFKEIREIITERMNDNV